MMIRELFFILPHLFTTARTWSGPSACCRLRVKRGGLGGGCWRVPATSVRQPGARAKRAGHQQHRALWLQEARARTCFFFRHTSFASVHPAVPVLKPKVQATDYGGRRLGREGGSASCAAPRRSLNSKGSPSTLAVCARGRDRRLAARARAAAKESNADQRVTYAAVALERRRGGAARVRLRARSRMNCAASVLQRQPSSIPSTTSRHRAEQSSSGYVRSFALRAMRRAAPAVERWWRRACPAESKADTSVVSTASWATAPKRETVGDDLDAPLVLPLDKKVGRDSRQWPRPHRKPERRLARVGPPKASRRRLQGQNAGTRGSCRRKRRSSITR